MGLLSRPAVVALGLLIAVPAPADEHDRLVQRGRAEADVLWRRGLTIDAPAIDSVLQRVMGTVTEGISRPPGVELRVHVLRSPEINAFALPDGSVYLFAGLLSELTTRDQAAFVLRHEAEHALQRHALKNIGQAKSKVAVLEVLSLASTVLIGSAVADAFAQLGLGLAAAYSVNGYGRGLEKDADIAAAHSLPSAGFDSCAGIESLQAMLREGDEPGRLANLFWGDHPRLNGRIRYLSEAMGGRACEFDSCRVAADYAPIKWPMLKLAAQLWTAGGDRENALRSAGAYRSARPEDPEAYLLLGDAYGGAAAGDTLRLAGEAYRRSLELAPQDYRPPLRGLALLAEQQGDTTGCIGYLERYLSGSEPLRDRRSLTRKLQEMKARFPDAPGAASDSSHTSPVGDAVDPRKEP